MDALNKKYHIKIEVLTPLSIGAGAEKDWARGVDFVVRKGQIHKLNLKKMSQVGIDLSRLSTAFAEKDEGAIINLISDNLLTEVSDETFTWPAESPNDIKTFIRNQLNGKPLLVGSSLKGAVRSILFDHITQNELKTDIEKNLKDNKKRETPYFGSSKDGDEFMRFIKFADTEFESTTLVNTKIFNLQKQQGWQGGWKHGGKETNYNFKNSGFNTIYECIMPGQFGHTSIMLSLKAFEAYKQKGMHKYENEKQKILGSDVTTLFKVINQHTHEYLLKEKAFFQKYNQAEKTQEIINSIDNLLAQIPSDNSFCILKMSAGSGFHSITGDWQFDDYSKTGVWDDTRNRNYGKQKYKSRKIAVWDNHFDLMGFVKLSALSEEEVQSLQEKKRQELAEREAKQKELAEKERLEREERERQEQEYRRNLKEYTEYCLQTKQAFEKEKWTDVLTFAEKASSIFPDKAVELKDLVEKAKSNITLAESQRSVEEAKQREEEERKQRNSVPLSDKIANVGKLPTLFGNLKTWMKQNNLQSLSEDELKVLHNKIVEIYTTLKDKEKASWKTRPNQWKGLTTLLGQELVEKWLQEL